MTALSLARQLQAQFGDLISAPVEFRQETTVSVADAGQITAVCAHAKNQLGFDYLVDITAVDNYPEAPRFTIVYELYGYSHRCHLRLKTDVDGQPPKIPSVTSIWQAADWHEREAYDLMGVRFAGHPDLRRILMWEGYPYYPLRKDFPLAGKPTDQPDGLFTRSAPLEGGPFVTVAGGADTEEREPRARTHKGKT